MEYRPPQENRCDHRKDSMIPGKVWVCVQQKGHGGKGHYCKLVDQRDSK